MEEWNAGILGVKEKKTILIVKKSFKPIIPILHLTPLWIFHIRCRQQAPSRLLVTT
jgi:hypothetical protein